MFTAASELQEALRELEADAAFWQRVGDVCVVLRDALRSGHTILIAGNGGSAAEADHFAAEIVGRYMRERRGYPAIALAASAATMTAIGNDYGYSEVFSRQVEAFGKPGDVLCVLSTSGNSENIKRAVQKAKEIGMTTVSFLGKGGGDLRTSAEYTLIVPGVTTARIQELHLLVIHAICEEVEKGL